MTDDVTFTDDRQENRMSDIVEMLAPAGGVSLKYKRSCRGVSAWVQERYLQFSGGYAGKRS